MKKFITIAALLLSASLLIGSVGCAAPKADSGDKIKIVCTIFPQYDWTRQIIGDKAENFELTLLLDDKIDLHSYQPTVDDIAKISACDLFIYVGGESDEWVADALSEAVNKNMAAINLLETLGGGAKQEELKEGMQSEGEGGSEEAEAEYDEHVWLSLKNAELFCKRIRDALFELDGANANAYVSNADAYIEKLAKLDAEYGSAVQAAAVKTVLFGDRFPFRYLADDYGLDYYAAFAGCSAETEASFETVVFLAKKIDEFGLNCIIVIEDSDKRIAETVRGNTASKDQRIAVMDSMQSVSAADVQNGASYLAITESNLAALKQALE